MWSRLVLVLMVSAGCRELLGIEEAQLIDAPGRPPDGDGGNPDAPRTPAEVTAALLAEWSGCMSLANFKATMMSPAWANLASSVATCQDCHFSGANGFIATPDEGLMFDLITRDRFYMQQFFAVDLADGPNPAKVVVNAPHLDRVATAQPPHAGHPTFPVMNVGMAALTDFHELTRLRRLQGMCDPPRLPD